MVLYRKRPKKGTLEDKKAYFITKEFLKTSPLTRFFSGLKISDRGEPLVLDQSPKLLHLSFFADIWHKIDKLG